MGKSAYTFYLDDELIRAIDAIISVDNNNRSAFVNSAIKKAVDERPLEDVEESIRRNIDASMRQLETIKSLKAKDVKV